VTETKCKNCLYENVCSDERKTRHKNDCEHCEKHDPRAFYPGGVPPRKFCPICVHKDEKCISSLDIKMYALNRGLSVADVRKWILEDQGYVLTEYSMLEGHCMTSCDRFKEID
jgi:hypothetical protein